MRLIKMLDRRFPTEKSKQKTRFGLYECSFCGGLSEKIVENVRKGNTSHCGCRIDYHGGSKTKLYYVYVSMINRCYLPKVPHYDRYGGRGITVCEEWRLKFSNFKEWALNNGYKECLSIDRINNDKGYSPDNCRWTDFVTQATNTVKIPKNNTTGFRGVTKDKHRFRVIVTANKVRYNVGTYKTLEEAVIKRDNFIKNNKFKNILNKELLK